MNRLEKLADNVIETIYVDESDAKKLMLKSLIVYGAVCCLNSKITQGEIDEFRSKIHKGIEDAMV